MQLNVWNDLLPKAKKALDGQKKKWVSESVNEGVSVWVSEWGSGGGGGGGEGPVWEAHSQTHLQELRCE